ncbi:MAG: flexitail domain-containing putative surface protein, partial [Phycisphaeraceae bacterium]
QGDCSGSSTAVAAPPEGLQAAMTNQGGPGSHVLYRCDVPASGFLSFELYINNEAGVFLSPLSLDYTASGNQQFRADLVTPSGIATDPFTLASGDILLNIYQTQPGDPAVSGYATVTADISAYIGQTVCLRFAQVDNQSFFHAGVDAVQFNAIPPTPTPSPTPCPPEGCPTATITPTPTETNTPGPPTPTPSGPEMSLSAAGLVQCDVPDKPSKCTAVFVESNPKAAEFQLTVEANIDFEISGFGAEVYFSGLTYNQDICEDEVVMPNMVLPVCFTGSKGQRQLGGITGLSAPLPAANPGGVPVTLTELDVHCPATGTFKVGLTANSGTSTGSVFGAIYADVPNANPVTVAVVGQQDFGNGPVDIADTLDINCVLPPTPTPTPTETPVPPTATPVPIKEEMVLAASGPVACDDPDKPTKCTAVFDETTPKNGEFQIVLKTNIDFEIAGFGSELYFGGLTYNEDTCADEIVMPNTVLPFCNNGPKGQPQPGGATGFIPPFPAANPGGTNVNLVELDVHCGSTGTFKVGLTANSGGPDGAAFGAIYFSVPDGVPINVAVVGQQDFGNGPVDIADTLDINCVAAADAEWDTDGDGCRDAVEISGAVGSETTGGLRDPLNVWDFYDTPDALGDRDRSITIGDIFAVAGRFGATGDPGGDPLAAPIPAAPAYHAAFDRGGQDGANTWNQAPADGAITIGDIFAVAGQFGHSCA